MAAGKSPSAGGIEAHDEACRQPIRIDQFIAGRDLAVAMLREPRRHMRANQWSIVARYRSAPADPQHRWALKYLLELQAHPELLDGFSAVLSDYFVDGCDEVEIYAGVNVSELMSELDDPD